MRGLRKDARLSDQKGVCRRREKRQNHGQTGLPGAPAGGKRDPGGCGDNLQD